MKCTSKPQDRGALRLDAHTAFRVVSLALTALWLSPAASRAQDHQLAEIVRPFPVLDATLLEAPFLGGFDLPRPQFVDIDGDGDPDLFVQENTGSVMYFENVGSEVLPAFRFETFAFRDLDVGAWSFFVDLDTDGDADLLAELSLGRIRAYRNVGSAGVANFEIWADTLRDSGGKPVLAEPPSVPFAQDVDCNGRVDLMIGQPAGTITRFEMVSPTGQPPVFDLVDDMYQGIQVIGGMGKRSSPSGGEHGFSAMAFADMDRDGDPDLLWGDFFEPNVIYFRNEGSCPSAAMVRITDDFMSSDTEVLDTSGLNVPRPVDIDMDGDVDLFVGVMGGAFVPTSTSIDNFYYLEAENAGFQLITKRFIRMLDVGSTAAPLFFDMDADSDPDLLIGNVIDPRDPTRGSLTLFRNTGTREHPKLELLDTDFLGFDRGFSPVPAAADIDDDGDMDLFFGTFGGEVVAYRNDGSPQLPDWTLETDSYLGLDVGADCYPAFGDLDGDGDQDLLVGESSGLLNYFRNVGSASSANLVLETESFAGIDVGQKSRPSLIDYDGDGDLDLFVGSDRGTVFYFRNEGSPQEPAFVMRDPAVSEITGTVSPATADVDGDGDVDLLVGTASGGGRFFRNEIVPTHLQPRSTGMAPVPSLADIFPNPAHDRISVTIVSARLAPEMRLDVLDMLGRVIRSASLGALQTGRRIISFDLRAVAPGPLVLHLAGPDGTTDSAVIVVL